MKKIFTITSLLLVFSFVITACSFEKKEAKEEIENPVKTIEFNKTITLDDMMEITFIKCEWSKEIKNSSEQIIDKCETGKIYCLVYAKIKNISAYEWDGRDINACKVTINDKYSFEGYACVFTKSEYSFNNAQFIMPLEERYAVFEIPVGEEVYNSRVNTSVEIALSKNSDAIVGGIEFPEKTNTNFDFYSYEMQE